MELRAQVVDRSANHCDLLPSPHVIAHVHGQHALLDIHLRERSKQSLQVGADMFLLGENLYRLIIQRAVLVALRIPARGDKDVEPFAERLVLELEGGDTTSVIAQQRAEVDECAGDGVGDGVAATPGPRTANGVCFARDDGLFAG